MGPFLRNIVAIENHFKHVLQEWGKVPGDDVVLMVMNEGEMDLLVNFACSCHTHNISMSHMMVVAASESILPMIRATGYSSLHNTTCLCSLAILVSLIIFLRVYMWVFVCAVSAVGVYHESFAFAPETASKEYLDHTFVDMMWYKVITE